MILVFAVRDLAAETYLPLFVAPNRPLAVRNFGDWCSRKDDVMGRHPEDFELHQLGLWDEESGRLVPSTTPDVVCRGAEVAHVVAAS